MTTVTINIPMRNANELTSRSYKSTRGSPKTHHCNLFPKNKLIVDKRQQKKCQWVRFFHFTFFLSAQEKTHNTKMIYFVLWTRRLQWNSPSHKKLEMIKNEFFSNKNHVVSHSALLPFSIISSYARAIGEKGGKNYVQKHTDNSLEDN